MTLVDARVRYAWVSRRVREGVLASSEVFGDTEYRARGFPKPVEAIRGASEALWGKRGWADARYACSPGETLVVSGCAKDLFPGRDWTSARLRRRPIPRGRLYIFE